MLELLSGVVTGAGMLGQIPFWLENTDFPLNIGHSFIAIDIASLMDPEELSGRIEWMVDTLRRSPIAEGSAGIFMPGELEWQREEERRARGIPISPEVYQDLQELASRYQESLRTV